jgi:hypothetical protein
MAYYGCYTKDDATIAGQEASIEEDNKKIDSDNTKMQIAFFIAFAVLTLISMGFHFAGRKKGGGKKFSLKRKGSEVKTPKVTPQMKKTESIFGSGASPWF